MKYWKREEGRGRRNSEINNRDSISGAYKKEILDTRIKVADAVKEVRVPGSSGFHEKTDKQSHLSFI